MLVEQAEVLAVVEATVVINQVEQEILLLLVHLKVIMVGLGLALEVQELVVVEQEPLDHKQLLEEVVQQLMVVLVVLEQQTILQEVV
jgi:hypothetical protein